VRPSFVYGNKRYKEKSLVGVKRQENDQRKTEESTDMESSYFFKLAFYVILIELVISCTDTIFIEFCVW
jgi:hypothetical protein